MPSKQQKEESFQQLAQVMRDLESDLGWRLKNSPRIPAAWHEIAQSRIQPLKRPLTMRVDEDVVKFFRAMGQGYLTRMNAVLRTFMLARLAEVVKAEEEFKPPPKYEEEYRYKMGQYSKVLQFLMFEDEEGEEGE